MGIADRACLTSPGHDRHHSRLPDQHAARSTVSDSGLAGSRPATPAALTHTSAIGVSTHGEPTKFLDEVSKSNRGAVFRIGADDLHADRQAFVAAPPSPSPAIPRASQCRSTWIDPPDRSSGGGSRRCTEDRNHAEWFTPLRQGGAPHSTGPVRLDPVSGGRLLACERRPGYIRARRSH